MSSRTEASRPSGHALILFGVLLTIISLENTWRHYTDEAATGWNALEGRDSIVTVMLVLIVAAVVLDVLTDGAPQPRTGLVIAAGLIAATAICLILVGIGVGNESPPVFDGQLADDGPQGPAFATLGGLLTALIGSIVMLRSPRAAR